MISFGRPTILLYGGSGIGKTSAVIQALRPQSTYWITTERGALIPATDPSINHWGAIPAQCECLSTDDPFRELDQAVKSTCALVRAGKYAAIVIDTLSSWAEREYLKIATVERVPESYGRANRTLRNRLLPLVNRCLEAGAILVTICHEKDPQTIEGRSRPGGPKLPGDLLETIPSLFDQVIRIGVESDLQNGAVRVARVNELDRSWVTKDRYGVIKRPSEPLDLRAFITRAIERSSSFRSE